MWLFKKKPKPRRGVWFAETEGYVGGSTAKGVAVIEVEEIESKGDLSRIMVIDISGAGPFFDKGSIPNWVKSNVITWFE